VAQKFIVPITIKQLASAGSDALTVFVDQEDVARVKIDAGGKISWSDGSASSDTNLFRAASGAIATPGYFSASGGLQTSVVSASPTVSLPNGALIVDNSSNSLYFRANNQWIAAGAGQGNASLTISDTPPAEPSSGDLWFESDSAKTFVYYDSFWVEVGSSGSTDSPTSLVGLSDVAFSTLENGDFLKYNSSASVWTNDPINLGTDTVGNYVSGLHAGSGIAISHTPGEGSTASISIESTEWTSYTPTITADGGGFSLGNGVISGRYKQIGKTVFFYAKLVYGSTTSPGSGHWNFGLPVTAHSSNFTFSASILDSGVAWYGGIGNGNYTGSTTSFAVNVTSPSASTATWVVVGNGGPFTWGDADNITISGSYEAA
jgi:hypothetical protein